MRAMRTWRSLVLAMAIGVIAFLVVLESGVLAAAGSAVFMTAYLAVVLIYLVSRFVLSLRYRPVPTVALDDPSLPTLAVVIPVMNEEDGIGGTIASIYASDYPAHLLRVVVIDDGSTDGTWDVLEQSAAMYPRLEVFRFAENRGKRAAMAVGVRAVSDSEMICFIDSDSFIEPDALRAIVSPMLGNPDIAGVSGHADVANPEANLLTRLQRVRYFGAFRLSKAAESVLGAVTCASGCFTAYRTEPLLRILPRWEDQRFLGRPSTFGDDRALTNYLLRDYSIVYQDTARSTTTVPVAMRGFLRQQARWKRSWTRESIHVSRFIWRKHPAAAAATYASIVFQLVGPIVFAYCLIARPIATGVDPWTYLIGFYAMAVLYSLYFAWRHADPWWWAGTLFVALYATVLIWQVYWAMLTVRTTSWGTRPSRLSGEHGPEIISSLGPSHAPAHAPAYRPRTVATGGFLRPRVMAESAVLHKAP